MLLLQQLSVPGVLSRAHEKMLQVQNLGVPKVQGCGLCTSHLAQCLHAPNDIPQGSSNAYVVGTSSACCWYDSPLHAQHLDRSRTVACSKDDRFRSIEPAIGASVHMTNLTCMSVAVVHHASGLCGKGSITSADSNGIGCTICMQQVCCVPPIIAVVLRVRFACSSWDRDTRLRSGTRDRLLS